MKGFDMDDNGDVVVRNNVIPLVSEQELLRQKVKNVLHTNLGEWFLNEYEGINFDSLLGKGVVEELVRAEVEKGLSQVDSGLVLTAFRCNIDNSRRKMTVDFTARTGDGTEVEGEYSWD